VSCCCNNETMYFKAIIYTVLSSGKITGDELRRILTQLGKMRLSMEEADELIGGIDGLSAIMYNRSALMAFLQACWRDRHRRVCGQDCWRLTN
jgi:hypothetical protein